MNSLGHWDASDLGEVARVLNDASPFDQFAVPHVQETVFEDSSFNPDLLRCTRIDGRIVAVTAGVVREQVGDRTTPTGFIKLIAVDPRYQGQGIGSALLADIEGRLAARGATAIGVFGDSPGYLRPGVDFRLTRLICLLLRRGYASRHDAVNMEVDLARANLDTAADERRLISAEIEVRRLASYDADAFAEYMLTQWQRNWQIEALRALRRDPVSCHLALRHGEILGFAAHDVSGPGQFGPMGVRADLRKHGIGGVLLKRCLADLRDAGYRTADIQWVGPIAFYARQVDATLSRCFWQMWKLL